MMNGFLKTFVWWREQEEGVAAEVVHRDGQSYIQIYTGLRLFADKNFVRI